MTTITIRPDGLGGGWVYAGPVRLGHVFPARTTGFPHYLAVPGRWFGRRTGGKAKPFESHDEAYAYVTEDAR
jgi:hypothetical protein